MVETPKWPELARGQKGTNVKALQLLLRYRGANISADGDFGTNTYNAVLSFQTNNGLRYKDGVAGQETLSALITTIKSRTINDAAWAAQNLLGKFENLTIDSDFWTGSEKATKNFQTKMGFSSSQITGTVTPITWRYLFGYNSYPSEGGGSSGNAGVSGNKDYRGRQILTDSQFALINGNKQFYVNAGKTYNIPWQMLAAIHYRESKFYKGGPSNNHNGPYQIWGSNYPQGNYSDSQFEAATNDAARFLREEKLGNRDCFASENNVKYGFYAYNGINSAYYKQAINLGLSESDAGCGGGSPYVMNLYDARRDPTVEPTKSNRTWGQITSDNGPMKYPANTDYGAYIIYRVLMNLY